MAKELNRNIGIDILKACACLLVVALHTIDSTMGWGHRIITATAVMGIPVFFTTSGLFILSKDDVSYSYVIRKIGRILIVCFVWEFLYSLMLLIVKHEWRPFLESFAMDFLQKGLFYHFWYLGAMILLYLICPLLHKLIKSNPGLYIKITIGLGIFNALLDIAQFIAAEQFVLHVIQTFRIWIWVFYFMCGGAIALYSKGKPGKNSRILVGGILAVYFAMIAWMLIGRRYAYGNLLVEGYYSALPVILFAAGCTLLCYRSTKTGALFTTISKLAKYNMGIYIVHPFVLSILKHFIKGFGENVVLNLLFCPVVYLASLAIAVIIHKIPVLNKLVKM